MGTMKKTFCSILVLLCLVMSCTKQKTSLEIPDPIPAQDLEKISNLGFSISSVRMYGEGYLIENDMFIHRDSLDKMPVSTTTLRIAQSEQYRTFNTVKVPRTISISGELLGNKLDAAAPQKC